MYIYSKNSSNGECLSFVMRINRIDHKGIEKTQKSIIVFDLNMTLNSFDLDFQMTIQLSVKWNANLSKQIRFM